MAINGDPMSSGIGTGQRDAQANLAGRMIYDRVYPGERPPYDSIPPPIGEDSGLMESGVTLDPLGRNGKMSSTRRTFCLFLAFDVILMFILWVIYTQLIGDSGYKAFERQVKNYTFKLSLFDTVMLSAVRFTILMLAYCLFRLRHWIVIAICTTLSSAMLIVKIFFFDFSDSDSKSNPLSYCLIIIAFVLTWMETWFLDFKVLPYEKKMEHRLKLAQERAGYGAASNVSRYQRLYPDDMNSILTDDHQFYSPMDSPADSDNEETPRRSTKAGTSSGGGGDYQSLPSTRSNTRQENDYVSLGKHCFEVLWSYINTPEGDWKLETGTDETTGIVHSKKIKGVGKVFRLQAFTDISARKLYEKTALMSDETPSWNPTLSECRTLQVVDEETDVIYSVAAEIAGGMISSRDFVNVRRWGERNGFLIGSSMACNHPEMPPQKSHVRGINGAGGWVYKEIPGEPDKSLFMWFMNTDIKGWFPQKLIDANMSKVQMDCVGYIRDYIVKLNEESAS